MTDLETKLAEARELHFVEDLDVFDAAAAIAREVVAEKDAEITRIKALCESWYREARLAKPRKVTDAQREAIFEFLAATYPDVAAWSATYAIVAILESTDELAAK